MDFTRIDGLYAAQQAMKKLEEEKQTKTHKVLTITTEETTHKEETQVIHSIERKPTTYFKKLNHPEDIESIPTKPVPSYAVERKTAKRIPLRNEFIEGNDNDFERYYWSNRIEVVDGRVIVTPILKRIEA
jgi:hypothetical protein